MGYMGHGSLKGSIHVDTTPLWSRCKWGRMAGIRERPALTAHYAQPTSCTILQNAEAKNWGFFFRFVAPEFKDLTGRKQAPCLKTALWAIPAAVVGELWLPGPGGGNHYVAGKKTLGGNLSTCNAERRARQQLPAQERKHYRVITIMIVIQARRGIHALQAFSPPPFPQLHADFQRFLGRLVDYPSLDGGFP